MIRPRPLFNHPPEKNVFVMMRYRAGERLKRIENTIQATLKAKGLNAMFAKDAAKEPLLWPNVRVFMDNCQYGIAVFDGLPIGENEARLNPNVCIELGYMVAQDKRCLILKDKNVKLATDLLGFIWEDFDCENLDHTLAPAIDKWVEDTVRVLPLLQAFAHMLPRSRVASRINQYAIEKLAIGKFLSQEYFALHKPKRLILDSGTSAAAVAEALCLNAGDRRLTVHTNNLLASLLLSTVTNFKCQVVPGEVDEDFAGVFGPAARFTAQRGPYANSSENLEFKRAILENNQHTIIVVPADRLGVIPIKAKPVIGPETEWKRLLNSHVEMVVTCPELPTPTFRQQQKALRTKLKIVHL
jgi:hypothetical protein